MKAVWLQDWVGTFKFPEGVRLLWNWQLNRHHYPDWDGMVDSWAAEGVRPMLYINPYFANLTGNPDLRTNYFKEGDEQGVFVKNSSNQTLQIQSVSINFAQIDFTNPDAWTWATNLIIDNMLKEAKSVGWMHDFGEYVPLNAKYKNWPENSSTYHNAYPL